MEFAIAMGVAAVLQALEDKKAYQKYADKLAKVYVKIERVADKSPTLGGAIIAARRKQ